MLTIPQVIGILAFIIFGLINLRKPHLALPSFASAIAGVLCAFHIIPKEIGVAIAFLLVIAFIIDYAAGPR